jgi:hypothetical protein
VIEMGAIAKGKVNASEAQAGMRIIVKVRYDAEGHATISPSQTKTGEGVFVARIIEKGFRAAGRYEARGKYVIHTSAGSFDAAPIQTMWLAPEDSAGIKRAHAEALEMDKAFNRAPSAEELETAEQADQAETIRVAADKARAAGTAEGAAEIMAEALGISPADVAAWVASNWTAPEVAETSQPENLTLHSQDGKVDNNSEDEPEGDKMTTETAPAKKHTGSAVVQLLERVWDRIRENHPELPQAVIVTGTGSETGGLKWGHFRADGWQVVREEGAALRMNEMFMAGETLAKGALQVLQTMLHEGAHTLARVREIQDTSRQHRWHNAKFRTLAEEMGLEYTDSKADAKLGFSAVTLTEETKAEYADLIEELDKEISLVVSLPGWLGGLGGLLGGLGGDPLGGDGIKGRPTEAPTNTSSNLKLTCTCEEPNIIRASRKVAEKLVVRCEDCESLFRER